MIQVCNSKIRTAGAAMATPLGFPDLNFDILFYIISRLARRDVACLSCTCQALRRALSPELPRGGVTLEARHLTSFVLFADVKHGEDRLRYLHTLVLPGSTYQSMSSSKQDIEGALSTVLLATPNLGSLSILDLKVLSFRPETLKKVFQSLSRLRELEITVIQKKYEGEGVLEDVLPRLRRLSLTFDEPGIDANAFLRLPPEAPQNKLREVTLDYGMFDPPSSSFPAVRTLRVSPFTLPSDIDALTDLFPNVEDVTLDFRTNYCLLDSDYSRRAQSLYLPDTPWTDPAAKTCRDHLLNRPERKADAWPHIQSLRITGLSINDVAWVGLACQVPRLEVCCRLLNVQPLAGILRELRTSCAVFHPGVFHAPGKTRSGGWGMLRALETAPCVTRLAIILCQGWKNCVWHALQWSVRRVL